MAGFLVDQLEDDQTQASVTETAAFAAATASAKRIAAERVTEFTVAARTTAETIAMAHMTAVGAIAPVEEKASHGSLL